MKINSYLSSKMTIRNLTFATAAAALMLPAIAHAQVTLDATEVRSFDVPDGFSVGQAQIQSTRDGKTVIAGTTGQDADTACTVIVADGAGASEYVYQYQGGPTACVGVLPHPDGGFFVRGVEAVAQPQPGDVIGFTARIDAEGTEVWALPDQELVDANAEADGGTGEFLGQYVEPHSEMAYSAEFDKLLAFTNGNLNVGGGQALTQAHVVNVDDGDLRVSGQIFGLSGAAGVVAETTSRTSDGYFLLYIYSAGSQGAEFFSYNGRSNISVFRPLGDDWSQRYVRQMVYGPDDNVHLLWTPENDPAAPTNVTVVDDQAAEVWSASWNASVVNPDPEGESPLELGLPLGMWVGSNYTLVLYSASSQLVLRVADVATGESLGVAPLGGLTEHSPTAILNGDGGSLKLLAVNSSGTTVHEFRLEISEGSGGSGADAGGDAGLADGGSGSGSGSGGGDDGCATSAPAAPAPVSGAVLAILLAVFTIANRRRSSC